VSANADRQREAADVERWIREALLGNREALGRLLDMCRHYLLLVATQELTPTLQVKVSPSDIVQETMMKAVGNFLRFQGHTHEELLAWLRCTLRNNVINARMHFEASKRQIDREIPLTEATGEGFQQNLLDRGENRPVVWRWPANRTNDWNRRCNSCPNIIGTCCACTRQMV